MSNARLSCIAAALSLGLAAPVLGQGEAVYPPIPGPFVGMQSMAGPGLPAPQAMGSAFPPGGTGAQPMFQPPANALRVPYWMQQAPSDQFARAPASGDDGGNGGDGSGGGTSVPTSFGQTRPAATAPNPVTPPPAAQGYGVAPQGWTNGMPPQAPGYGGPPQGWGYGYGYGAPPGWAAQPYAPQPGWGGGWAGQQPPAGYGN